MELPLHLFDYDSAVPLEAQEQPMGVHEGLQWTHVTFSGGGGRRVPGVFVTEAHGTGSAHRAARSMPGVLLQHGAGASKYARFVTACIDVLGHAGYACLALDAIGHGERAGAIAPEDEAAWRRLRGSPEFVTDNVVDFRRGLDYLAARPEVDGARLAYAGSSMGAMLGAILGAIDPRPRVVILRCGGARTGLPARVDSAGREEEESSGARFELLDHLRYVGHIAPRPLLMLNNTEDEVFGRDAVLRLFEAAGEPKELRWFPGDHRANHELHAAEVLEWLEKQFEGA
ncbi:MAG TPA: hypothetical protein VJM51_00145 [Dehalococcoidia bacterium]|nr:hypothetical protein [Dehalococcoidia bacterium]